MTIAEQLRQEGYREGYLEGRIEGRIEGRMEALELVAREMLTLGWDLAAFARYTDFTLQDLADLLRTSLSRLPE